MKNRVSIIIVNYNGRELLKECMPSVMEAADFSDSIYEIMVVDNASTDDSLYFLKKEYPAVTILPLKVNRYWFSINEGVKRSAHDRLLLLNNDVKLDRPCVKYLLESFNKDDETIFAVTPTEMLWDESTPTRGAQGLEVRNGIFFPGRSYYFDKAHITFKADNSMYAKDKLIKLGLFDPIFTPFYYEDVDISYRAWKAGFKIIYEPKAVIYHKSGSTINKHTSQYYKSKYAVKNGLLFVWKNITDMGLYFKHIIFLSARLIKALLFYRTERYVLSGCILAVKSLKGTIVSRKAAMRDFVLSDREILNKLDAKKFDEGN